MSVYFHGNFSLNRIYMAGVLSDLLSDPNKSDLLIAEKFGYKAPFTIKQKAWLQKSGIIRSRTNVLTEIGDVICKHDSQLKSLVTQWLIHHSLIASPDNAEAWHFFIKEFLVENSTFSKEDLEEELANKFMPHSMKHFKKGSPMNKVITRKVLECYTETRALGDLKIIIREGKTFKRGNPSIQGPWKSINQLEEDLVN